MRWRRNSEGKLRCSGNAVWGLEPHYEDESKFTPSRHNPSGFERICRACNSRARQFRRRRGEDPSVWERRNRINKLRAGLQDGEALCTGMGVREPHVVPMTESFTNKCPECHKRWRKARYKREPGVYVVDAGPCVKIGISNRVEERVQKMQMNNHEMLVLAHWEPCESPRELEVHLHRVFHDHHRRGEWYNVSPEAVKDAIRQYRGE